MDEYDRSVSYGGCGGNQAAECYCDSEDGTLISEGRVLFINDPVSTGILSILQITQKGCVPFQRAWSELSDFYFAKGKV